MYDQNFSIRQTRKNTSLSIRLADFTAFKKILCSIKYDCDLYFVPAQPKPVFHLWYRYIGGLTFGFRVYLVQLHMRCRFGYLYRTCLMALDLSGI